MSQNLSRGSDTLVRRPLERDLAERLCGKIQARGAQCRVESVAQTPRREQPDDGDADDTMLIEVLADDVSLDESSLIHPLREGPLPSPPVGGVQAPPVPPRTWSASRPRRWWVVWAALPLCVGLWFLR
ncbi:MAG: hypothetical protein AB2813_03590 [Candidatus Sedimenticola endophacoides]